MSLTRLPKTTRWIFVAACLFFLLLTIYRLVMYGIFSNLFTGVKPGLMQALVLGTAFDARIMAMIISVIYFFSFWPGIHFFKNSAGKKLGIGLFASAAALLHTFYMADLVYLKCFGTRLKGSIISDLVKNTPRGDLFLSKIYWLPMIAILGIVVWLVIFLLVKFHKIISGSRSTTNPRKRVAWHLSVFVICLICIYGGFRSRPLGRKSLSSDYNKTAVELALTAPESFYTTLPVPSSKHPMIKLDNK